MSTNISKKKMKKFIVKRKTKSVNKKTTKKPRAKTKDKTKKNSKNNTDHIDHLLNLIKLGPDNYVSNELEYDYMSEDESVVESVDSYPNFSLINKLPQLYEISSVKVVCVNGKNSVDIESEEENEINVPEPLDLLKNESCDIDTDSLFKDTANGKVIYFDYNKNIIYNSDFVIIGTSTEDGEIELDDRYSEDYKELLEL